MVQPIVFTFPASLIHIELVNSISNLKEKLRQCREFEEITSKYIRYKFTLIKYYLYAKCRQQGCKATLNYRYNGQAYILSSSKTQHSHLPYSTKSQMYQIVSEYLYNIPKGVSLLKLKHAVCRSFHITEKQFYYVISRINNRIPTLNEYTSKLEDENYQIYVSQQQRQYNQPPATLVAVSPAMKKAFHIYGERVSFDLTFRLIKNKSLSGGSWKVGVFLGISSTNHLVPFGIAITQNTNKESYMEIFRMFFAAVGGEPKVIISDEERAIHAALNELQEKGQYSGIHLYDSFHILHNIYKKLQNKAEIRFYSNILHSKNEAELKKHLHIAEQKLDKREGTLLWNFLKNMHMYCFAAFRCKSFTGFTSSSSINESFHALIKRIQVSQKEYVIAFSNLVECSQKLIQKSQQFQLQKLEYQNTFKVKQIKGIRLCLTKSVFSHFLAQFAEIIHLQLIEKDEDDIIIKQYSYYFNVRPYNNKWQCNCGYSEKCMLPCRHLMKFLLYRGYSIIQHLPERWKTPGILINSDEPTTKGREKLSKRKVYF